MSHLMSRWQKSLCLVELLKQFPVILLFTSAVVKVLVSRLQSKLANHYNCFEAVSKTDREIQEKYSQVPSDWNPMQKMVTHMFGCIISGNVPLK